MSDQLAMAAYGANDPDMLRQLYKMEAIGAMAAGAAHDVNNLLTPVLCIMSELRDLQPALPRQQVRLSGALACAERAHRIVQQILHFARKQQAINVPADLRTVVAGMSEIIGCTVTKRIKLNVDVSGDLPLVSIDRNQVELALLNLVVNARDAMPDGGILTIAATIKRRAMRLADGSLTTRAVCLTVTDTGVGMDEETLRRIGEPFFSTKGDGKGTGLGLAMVRAAMDQMGGEFVMSSRLGEGSTAQLWFPITAE